MCKKGCGGGQRKDLGVSTRPQDRDVAVRISRDCLPRTDTPYSKLSLNKIEEESVRIDGLQNDVRALSEKYHGWLEQDERWRAEHLHPLSGFR